MLIEELDEHNFAEHYVQRARPKVLQQRIDIKLY